jgi:acyl carrier protein
VGVLTSQEGLELLDAARALDRALVLPLRLDAAALRAQARTGTLPALLRGLVRAPAARSSDAPDRSLARRLAGMSEGERERVLLKAVRAEAATVLGHVSPEAVQGTQTFKELGFDSLAAVELRNRLEALTGLHLPIPLAFDYPTPVAVSAFLLGEIGEEVASSAANGAAPVDEELDRLERILASAAGDEGQRARVSARLHGLLAKLDEGHRRAEDVAVIEQINSATAAEVFDFIDRELG